MLTKKFVVVLIIALFGHASHAQTQFEIVKALAKVNEQFCIEDLAEKGIYCGSQIGDIVTLTYSSDKSTVLSACSGIEYLHASNPVQPMLSKSLTDTRVDKVHQGVNLEQAYTGKDVIIGITDWGFDYTHPNFYDTALTQTRILAAWDQFKTSGPAPDGFNYGTEYEGEAELLAAESDTFNIYQYATHGSHVAGISGGTGAGTSHRGIAYEANFLFTTFLADEAAVLDAFAWMKEKADEYGKRLIINMSWGLYNLGPLDGTSLVSQAIDAYSDLGVVFVTSGGNNGGETFHIKHLFDKDTIQSRIEFYSYSAHPEMWGQNVAMWGEKYFPFEAGFTILDNNNTVIGSSPFWSTVNNEGYFEDYIVVGSDTVFYKAEVTNAFATNDIPHIRLRIKNENTSLRIGLKAYADAGSVHFYNVVELSNDVGNWGLPFSALRPGWLEGDDEYSLGEPASTKSVITVAAHQSETILQNGTMVGGFLAPFSSNGPTVDERMKPDISAPGVSVASSISSFTTRSYTAVETITYEGRSYPFARFSGTSMSAPAVAGIVALMLEANGNLMPTDVKEIIQATAREDIRTGELPEGGSSSWGTGKISADAAVKLAEDRVATTLPVFLDPRFVVFPNPANNSLFFDGEKDSLYFAKVYDSKGQEVHSGYINDTTIFDVSSLCAGLYIIRFEDEDIPTQKFIKTY